MVDGSDLGSEIISGVKDVFSTMLMVDLGSGEVFVNQEVGVESNITSMLGIGGGLRGMLAVHCPANVAQSITGSFLGMEVDELNEDVKDAIGEIANMIAGNLKVSCAKNDLDIELAIPTSIVGDSFVVSGVADSNRLVVPREMAEGKFWVELIYAEKS